MKAITDLDKIKSFENKLSEITSSWKDLDTSYLERMNWVVILTEEEPFYWLIEENYEKDYEEYAFGIDVRSFVRTLKKMGYQICYAWVEGGGPDSTFELEINEEEILEFAKEGYKRYIYYTLFPKDYSFVVLDADDYSLVAGQKEFVESIIECDIETAMNAFKKGVTTGWAEPNSKDAKEEISFFLNIYEKYKSHNEKVLRKLGGG